MDNKPIRVAHIMGKLWAGGVEAVVFNYYKAIDKTKIQFDLYYDSDSTVVPPQELIDMGARFIEIPPYQHLFAYLKTLKKYFKENNYTIVHSHINTLSVFPLFAAWQAKIPIRIAHNHSVPGGNEIKRNLLKNFLKLFSKVFANRYCACSEKAGKWLFGEKTFNEGKVYVIKNAINFSSFIKSEEYITNQKEKLGIKDKFVVEHVGRFTYAKNHTFLLDAFYEIRKIKSNAVLLLVGDGELREKIEEKVKSLELTEDVIMIGQVADPENYYGLADIILLPSVFEGLSLTAVEAQASKVPIIVSEAIPNEAFISNGCLQLPLDTGAAQWAKDAIEFSNTKVIHDNRSNEYEDVKCAQTLCEWYLEQ